MAIGVTAVVMIVSGLRRMWRRERPSSAVGVADEVLVHRRDLSCRGDRDGRGVVQGSSRRATTDEREEDVFEARLLLDVLHLGRRHQRLELGERAVHEDPALVEDRDPVGELLGLVEVLRGEQDRGAAAGELADGLPHLQASLRGRARWSARRGRSPAGSRSGSSRCRDGDACRRSRSPPAAPPASVSEKRASRSSAIRPRLRRGAAAWRSAPGSRVR